jgi:NAD(P)-dependent dehydrogenase (short-subunit alcohol dehydrogenase family)
MREPSYDFHGSVVLVTGAAQGVGLEISTRFAAAGAAVAMTDIKGNLSFPAAVRALSDRGFITMGLTMDVTAERDVEAGVAQCVERFGKLDILVNNAGIHIPAPALDMSEDQWDAVVDVNLKGPWLCSKYAGRHMVRRGEGGRIISIGSTSSLVGVSGQINYQSSKTGLLGQVRTLALEVAAANITVNAVCPTLTRSAMGSGVSTEYLDTSRKLNGPWSIFPGVDMIETRDVAHATLWLASDAARYITGIALPVDAGFTCK